LDQSKKFYLRRLFIKVSGQEISKNFPVPSRRTVLNILHFKKSIASGQRLQCLQTSALAFENYLLKK
jgi:hypothetical protein